MRDHGLLVEKLPGYGGSDAAGVVVKRGENVSDDLEQGARVFFQGIIGQANASTFQEYVTIPADLVGKIPSNVTDEQAATICVALMAVVAAFYGREGQALKGPWDREGDKVGKGKSIIILGGSSSVGQYAIQLARLSGFTNIVTASSPSHFDLLKSIGASVIFDRNTVKTEDYIRVVEDQPLTFVLDSISSNETGLLGIDIIRKVNQRGADSSRRLIYLLNPTDDMTRSAEDASQPVAVKTVWGLGSAPDLRPIASAAMKALSGPHGYLARRELVPNKAMVVEGGLERIEEALSLNKKGVSGQKVVLRL